MLLVVLNKMLKRTHSADSNYSLELNMSRPEPPFPSHPEYMNGRLKKVDMESRLLRIKKGIHEKSWYPDWSKDQRYAAQQALNNALDILEEYDY